MSALYPPFLHHLLAILSDFRDSLRVSACWCLSSSCSGLSTATSPELLIQVSNAALFPSMMTVTCRSRGHPPPRALCACSAAWPLGACRLLMVVHACSLVSIWFGRARKYHLSLIVRVAVRTLRVMSIPDEQLYQLRKAQTPRQNGRLTART
jgi:hypothetical protein